MTKRHLECCCCGGDAGRWYQHWNRDTGYGICIVCASEERLRGVSEAEMESLYGRQGVHWGMTYELYASRFDVTAAFRTQDQANAWMLAHPDESLLAVAGHILVIAKTKDNGQKTFDL